MPIQLYVSNHLSGLKKQLVEHLKMHPPAVFLPYNIVSQTEGMNIWLKYQLADDLGIAANVKFHKPNDILFEIYILMKGNFQVTINRQSYVWILYGLLGESGFQKRYPDQAAFIEDDGVASDKKRLQLAERIADLFDQYQIYRQEYIQEWTQMTIEQAPNWQAYLWIKLVSFQSKDNATLQHINSVRDHILAHIHQPELREQLLAKLPVIYLFGLSVFTKYHLEVFYQLAQYIDIQFYLINPSPYIYWGDDKSEKDIAIWKAKNWRVTDYIIGNELLTSWGKLIQNTLKLLFVNEELINAYEPVHVFTPPATTLLNTIKLEIFENMRFDERHIITIDRLQDKSIQIHAHYTIQREVEGLYHYILQQMEHSQGSLLPRNILVVCSDIQTYASYIDGVFGNGPVSLKYKIADTPIGTGNSVFSVVNALLNLQEEQLSFDVMMSLLEMDIIKAQLKINDIEQLRSILQAANIRSGIKGNKYDQTYAISWWNGIRRIMFGICMSGSPLLQDQEEYFEPLDVIEGRDAMDLIRVCDFVLDIIQLIQQRAQPKEIIKWIEYIKLVIDKVHFQSGEELNEELGSFYNLLQEYTEVAEFYPEPISYELFYANFRPYLDETSQSSLFYSDGITFCTLVPMRSIPFQVVAMLGMDAGVFPRREKKLSFNLMHQQYQLGDRNIKDSDKHLFLETILSAETCLYMSYIGRSAKDNTERNPSILIEELLDYIQLRTVDINVRSLLVVEHPLHNFSALYNSGNPHLVYYSANADQTASILDGKALVPEQVVVTTSYHVGTITKFLTQPLAYFYQQKLGIYLAMQMDEYSEYEQFVFDATTPLERYKWNHSVIGYLEQHSHWNNFIISAQLNGALPLNSVGQYYAWAYRNELEPILAVFYEQVDGLLSHENCKWEHGLFTINAVAKISHRTAYEMILSTNLYKHFARVFLSGLIAYYEGKIEQTSLLWYRKGTYDIYTIDWRLYSKVWIDTYFQRLINYMEEGKQHPLELDIELWDWLYDRMQDELNDDEIELSRLWEQVSNEYVDLYKAHTKNRFTQELLATDFFNDAIVPIVKQAALFKEKKK